MTYLQAKTKTIQLLDQHSVSGNVTPFTDTNSQDYIFKFPAFFDTAQKEIATTTKYIYGTKKISQNPVDNLLGNTFKTIPYLMTDIVDMAYVGAKSYYFEVDNIATIYVEEETSTNVWNVLSTVNNATQGYYTAYRGFIVPLLATNTVRLRFTGLYPYNIRNRALYAYTYSAVAGIPTFGRYIYYTMPTNFWQLNKVLLDGEKDIGWEWFGKTLGIDYFARGDIQVLYYAMPTDIISTVTDSYVFEIDEEAAQAMPYYVASECFRTDPQNAGVSSQLYAIYMGKLANLNNKQLKGQKSIKNRMFDYSSRRLIDNLFR